MNVRRLFVASCLSLLTTSMVFAIRGDIEADLSGAFHLTKEQMGLIWGPAFWGFTLAIFVSGLIVDSHRDARAPRDLEPRLHRRDAAGALRPPARRARQLDLRHHRHHSCSTSRFLAMGLSQGLVEGVINPLVATIFNENKTHKLNVLHAWWPGGMVVGGSGRVVLTQLGASWQVKLASILIPAVIYLVMILGQEYPQDRARAVERLHRRHVQGGDEPHVPPPLRLHVDDRGQRAGARPVVPLDHEGPDRASQGILVPHVHRRPDVRPALLLRRASPTSSRPSAC